MAGSAVVVAVCSMRWRLMMYRMVTCTGGTRKRWTAALLATRDAARGLPGGARCGPRGIVEACRPPRCASPPLERYISAIAPASGG